MPNIIMMVGEHRNPDAIDLVIQYIYDSVYCLEGNAYMVMADNNQSIINSFKLVQNYYGKSEGKRVQHIVIGFRDNDGETLNGLYFIAEAAAKYISQRFQCCYGIHYSSENHSGYRHIHLVINPVSWVDGNRYYENDQSLYDLKAYLNTVTNGEFKWCVDMKESEPYVPGYQCGGMVNSAQDIIKQDRL